jgi:hypothetical protein
MMKLKDNEFVLQWSHVDGIGGGWAIMTTDLLWELGTLDVSWLLE